MSSNLTDASNMKDYSMMTDAYTLFAKSIAGEELTKEEDSFLREYNVRYTLARFLVMQKMNADGIKTSNFQFTPGDEFMKMPIVDIVNSLLEVYSNLQNATPLDFGDASWINNPPFTGRAKTKLGE